MKKLYIETYGCQMNVADSEVVASVMQMAGYETTETLDEADAVFLNTCSVRDNAEQKIFHRLDALDAERRKGHQMILGVLGCMAERAQQDLLDNHHCDLVAGPDAYLSLPDLIAQAELGHKAMNTELSTTETYKDVVPQRIGIGHKIGGFVSIMRGCNNFCHYCIVPYTRGRERSRDVESILREVRDLRDKGYKEVTLLGQNVNSYKLGDMDFPALLRRVAEEVPTMRVRFTTSHPKDMSDETLRVIAEMPNVCKHIHLPVQSGSDRILKLMNRKYTREWYMDRVNAIRRIQKQRRTISCHSHLCARLATIRPSCSNTLSAQVPTLLSIYLMTSLRRRKSVVLTSSLPCRQRCRPFRTRRMRVRSSTYWLRDSQNAHTNSFAAAPSRTRWWCSLRQATILVRPFV